MRHLWLIGMMGSGKTEVAATVADLNAARLVDCDRLIAERLERSIHQIFENEGEEAFRDYEQLIITEVACGTQAVIATGGGVVVRTLNVPIMRSTGTVIFLSATPSTLAKRIGDDAGRPLLSGASQEQVLTEILDERFALYERAAHATIHTDRITLNEVAEQAGLLWKKS